MLVFPFLPWEQKKGHCFYERQAFAGICVLTPLYNIYGVERDGSGGKDLGEHGERFQFGEARQVQAVVVVDVAEQAAALRSREAEEVHRGIVHAHEAWQAGGVGRSDEMVVLGAPRHEAGGFEVEVAAGGGVVQVGVETEETRQAQQKDEVKVGVAAAAGIEPLDGRRHVAEQGRGVGLGAQGEVEKLGQEERHRCLAGVVGKRGKGDVDRSALHALQTRGGTVVPFEHEQGQRAEQRVPDRGPARTGDAHHERHAARRFGEGLGYDRVVVVADCFEHNGP